MVSSAKCEIDIDVDVDIESDSHKWKFFFPRTEYILRNSMRHNRHNNHNAIISLQVEREKIKSSFFFPSLSFLRKPSKPYFVVSASVYFIPSFSNGASRSFLSLRRFGRRYG